MRTAFSRSRAFVHALLRVDVVVHAHGLRHLVADGEERVQRGHGVLQDHGDPLAADVTHLAVGLLQEVLALEEDLAAHDARRRREQAQEGQGERGLARAGLADDPEGLSRVERHRHLVDGAHDAGAPRADEVRREVLDLEQRARRHESRSVFTVRESG